MTGATNRPRKWAGKFEHKGNPAEAYDNEDEYPLTYRQQLQVLKMAVTHRFPLTDANVQRAIQVVLDGLDSKNDRVKQQAVKALIAMQRINQADDHHEDALPPIPDESETNPEQHVHFHGVTVEDVLSEIEQHPNFLEATQRRLERGDAGTIGEDGNS